MKKIILLALLAIVSVSAFAKKSYITVYAHPTSRLYNNDGYIIGDVPTDIEGLEQGDGNYYTYNGYTTALLNILSERGYEVEQMNTIYSGSQPRTNYLLSKEVPSNQTALSGDVNKDGKVNVSDVTTLVNIILGIVKNNPNLLEQIK